MVMVIRQSNGIHLNITNTYSLGNTAAVTNHDGNMNQEAGLDSLTAWLKRYDLPATLK